MKEIKSKKKTVYCLYTNAAKNAEEVVESRQQWRDSLVQKVSEMAEFFLNDEVPQKYMDGIKEDKMKEFFDNFELWSYNHITDESEMIKIAI
jgi:translation elongation factor EF-Ts